MKNWKVSSDKRYVHYDECVRQVKQEGPQANPRAFRSITVETSRGGDSRGNLAEGCVGLSTDRGDGRDADHDNQSEHHGVFHSGRAIFFAEEFGNLRDELVHG